jgi:hypothetical protein
MSNQQKSEFVNDIFHIQRSSGGHGKFLPKTLFIQKGEICLELLIQQRVEFPIAVICKSLTVWSHIADHRKADRVAYRNGIRDFWSFGQSKA